MRGWLMRWFPFATRAGRVLGERFTPLGKWLLATCAIAGIFSADPTRTHAFLLFTTSLALLSVSFVASLMWRPRVHARRELPPHASAGVTTEYAISLYNAGPRPLGDVRVADRLRLRYPSRAEFDAEIADAPEDNWFDRRVGFLRWQRLRQRLQGATLSPVSVPALLPGATARVRLTLCPLRRGWLQFDAVRLLQPDALGLCYAVLTIPLGDRVLSRPPTHAMPVFELPHPSTRSHAQGTTQRRGEGQEFFALRDYRPGDPPKFIDWRASARRGQPIVRQFAADGRRMPRLVLDACTARRTPADFETTIVIAASVLIAAAARGNPLGLQVLSADGEAPLFATVTEALDALATLSAIDDDTLDAWEPAFAAASDQPCVLVCARWDTARAMRVAALAARTPALVLSTDPLAAEAPQAIVIGVTARELPGLTWPSPARQQAS